MNIDLSEFLTDLKPVPAVVPPIEDMHVYGGDFDLCGPVLFLYRATARAHNEYEDSGDLCVQFSFTRYRAVRFTPRGAWVTEAPYWYDKPALRWVSLDGGKGKRLGHLSKADAMESLRHRNRRHVEILEWHLQCAEAVRAVLNQKAVP